MTPAATLKRFGRLGLRLAMLLFALCAAIVVGFAVYALSVLPPLQPWHTTILGEEFSAERDHDLDFNGYLKLEERLFAEMRSKATSWDTKSEAFVFSRFNPDSRVNQLVEGAPYNRSFRLQQSKASGHALLIHGLTDSPYSMKAMAESLHSRGFEVTVLRVPGHGTIPSMMTRMSVRDWTAAVRIAVRDVSSRIKPGQLFYIGGYSTGGTLALQYTLDALEDSSLRKPDRVLLVSPAIELTRLAGLANLLEIFSVIPVPHLQKARWQSVAVEYDPYKFNSFPVNATKQVNRATRNLQSDLAEAAESGRIGGMPPVLAFQSVVDSTVGPNGVADLLFSRLRGPRHRLVLFDVNRHAALGSVQRPAAGALIDRLTSTARGYTLDIVTNRNSKDRRISVRHLTPDGGLGVEDRDLEWPETLVSVGHVALPFPANDPAYGLNPGSGRTGLPSIGTWLFRGESGAVTVDLGSLTRPRSNPFWALIDEDVGAVVDADRIGRQQ
jgi:alpha-beta hydrolase superfamily lysophospholipase